MEEYITPQISREEFIKMFENGELKINNLQLKNDKILSYDSQFIFNTFLCEELTILIPDEKSSFEFYIKNIKCNVNLIELNYDNIEKLLISNVKKLTDKFIEYSVNIITKNDSPSTTKEFILNILNKVLQGFQFKIENIELSLHNNNTIFNCLFGSIYKTKENNVKIDNFNLFMTENSSKIKIINNFGVNILIEHSDNFEQKEYKLKIELKPLEIEINKKVYFRLRELIQIIQYNKYKQLYYKKKLYIKYFKPKIENNIKNKIYYRKLWIFAFQTIIKLRKYSLGQLNSLDFCEKEQKKIINDYYDNNNNLSILAIDNKQILLYSKEKIEKDVIAFKKKPKLNFAFLFGGNNNENKNELNEEEKNELDNLCKKENIEEFLKGNMKNKASLNPIENFFSNFMKKLFIEISLKTLKLSFIDDKDVLNIFFKEINVQFTKNEKIITSQISLNDIISINNISIFNERNNEKNALIIKLLESKKIDINFNFKNININEEIFTFILFYFLSFGVSKKYNEIFKETSYTKKK